MSRLARSLGVIAATAFRADAPRATGLVALSVVEGVSGAAVSWWMKAITDAAVARSVPGVAASGAGMAVTLLVAAYSNVPRFYWQIALTEKTAFAIDRRVIELVGALPGLEHFEHPAHADEIALLHAERERLSGTVGALTTNIRIASMLVSMYALLASVDPLLMVLPLFGIPSVFCGAAATRIGLGATQRTAERLREADHLFALSTTAGPGKELRVFGVSGVLRGRHASAWASADRELLHAGLRGTAWTAGGSLVFALGYVGALAVLVVRAAAGRVTPGDVVMALTLAGEVTYLVGAVAQVVAWLLQSLRTAGRLVWLQDHAASAARSGGAEAPDVLRDAIRLHDVTFTYPGAERPVLEHVDLRLPAGSVVALVGDNGAGKSTLVKLLCGFYPPGSGAITADGVDVAGIDPARWRARVAAGFQDFARFELPAWQTVGCGDLPRIDDAAAVDEALRRAGALDVPATLPDGLRTRLGRSFEGGVDVSFGQWQKLALGRAMMRDAPLLLVLDEPTASLDADTEHALFERYAGAARRAGAENGAVTVLVSHRFSTVRMADLIVVIDGGRVAEQGSHDELVARGGLYAELFELQARAYR